MEPQPTGALDIDPQKEDIMTKEAVCFVQIQFKLPISIILEEVKEMKGLTVLIHLELLEGINLTMKHLIESKFYSCIKYDILICNKVLLSL